MNIDLNKLHPSERYTQYQVLPFIDLWKVNNPIWMKQRQRDWEILKQYEFNDYPKSELIQNQNYFLHGEMTGYIPGITRWLLTPLMSPFVTYQFFYSTIFDKNEKKTLLYMPRIVDNPKTIEALPWIRQQSLNFIEGALGHEYQLLRMPLGAGKFRTFSPAPTYWSKNFIFASIKILEKGIFLPIIDTVDYFISCLKFSDDAMYRNMEYYTEMWALVEKVLLDKDANEYAKQHAENLKAHEQQIRDAWAIHAYLDENE